PRFSRDWSSDVCSSDLGAQLPQGADNLVIQAAETAWRAMGLPPSGWRVRVRAEIPLGSGLGSSATAIVGGVVAANALAGGRLSREEMLDIAVRLEGHPDNVTPALLGGFTVAVMDGPPGGPDPAARGGPARE